MIPLTGKVATTMKRTLRRRRMLTTADREGDTDDSKGKDITTTMKRSPTTAWRRTDNSD